MVVSEVIVKIFEQIADQGKTSRSDESELQDKVRLLCIRDSLVLAAELSALQCATKETPMTDEGEPRYPSPG
jgi:hypothetical protein